jgi:hypothetical protein
MDVEKLACGVWPLIEQGIRRYVEEHGRKPIALVLNPARLMQLDAMAESDSKLMDGVSLVVKRHVDGRSDANRWPD